jgi:uncharacterized protein (DUF302 family)
MKKSKKTIHERIEKLKKRAEKEGIKIEVIISHWTYSATNTGN